MFNTTPPTEGRSKCDKPKNKKKQRGEKKIKEWKLKNEKLRRHFEVKVQQKNNIKRGGWKQLCKNVLEAA